MYGYGSIMKPLSGLDTYQVVRPCCQKTEFAELSQHILICLNQTFNHMIISSALHDFNYSSANDLALVEILIGAVCLFEFAFP